MIDARNLAKERFARPCFEGSDSFLVKPGVRPGEEDLGKCCQRLETGEKLVGGAAAQMAFGIAGDLACQLLRITQLPSDFDKYNCLTSGGKNFPV